MSNHLVGVSRIRYIRRMDAHDGISDLTARVVAILRAHAEEQGMSYRRLSELSGVSKTKIQAVFSGERDILLPDMEAIAKALGLVGWRVMQDARIERGDVSNGLSVVPDTFERPDESLLAANTDEEEPEQ